MALCSVSKPLREAYSKLHRRIEDIGDHSQGEGNLFTGVGVRESVASKHPLGLRVTLAIACHFDLNGYKDSIGVRTSRIAYALIIVNALSAARRSS